MVQKCLTCARRRISGGDRRINNLETEQPGDILAVDMFGPIMYRGEHKYFLTMIDHFTRYARVVQVPQTLTSAQAWEVVYQEWVTSFGLLFI